MARCRAMLLGLLLPDPCDEHNPANLKKRARQLLPKVAIRRCTEGGKGAAAALPLRAALNREVP